VTDPVSWLQIEKGWNVVSADGVLVGKVVAVTGDEHDDNIRRTHFRGRARNSVSLYRSLSKDSCRTSAKERQASSSLANDSRAAWTRTGSSQRPRPSCVQPLDCISSLSRQRRPSSRGGSSESPCSYVYTNGPTR
jgi:hypothetical protein